MLRGLSKYEFMKQPSSGPSFEQPSHHTLRVYMSVDSDDSRICSLSPSVKKPKHCSGVSCWLTTMFKDLALQHSQTMPDILIGAWNGSSKVRLYIPPTHIGRGLSSHGNPRGVYPPQCHPHQVLRDHGWLIPPLISLISWWDGIGVGCPWFPFLWPKATNNCILWTVLKPRYVSTISRFRGGLEINKTNLEWWKTIWLVSQLAWNELSEVSPTGCID